MTDYAAARLNMVESQIRPNKVTDPAVIEAFLALPRETFVPETLRGNAYVDEDIPLGGGRYLMEPMVLGRLLQLAELDPGDTVLLVGADCGYGAAILSRLVRAVVAVESEHRLARAASARLKELGCANVSLIEGRLEEGYPGRAPYEAILFGGAVAAVPEAIAGQLATGGRLLAVVKAGAGMGKASLMTRIGGALSRRVVFDAGTPFLPGSVPETGFVF